MAYEISFEKKAEKELDRLPRPIQQRIAEAIDALATNPRPLGYKALKGAQKGQCRIRVANVYRVVYVIEDKEVKVLVVRVAHRRDVYR